MSSYQFFNSSSSNLPKEPTRDELIHINCPLQGLLISTSLGVLPWFEPALGWISSSDRQSVYQVKRNRGDSHVNVTLSGAYKEDGQPYNNIPGQDYSNRLDELSSLLNEVIAAGTHLNSGFKILLSLAGDGMSNPSRTYNDPVGLTYGNQWLMENIERIRTGLDSVAKWIVWDPGYDGVVPAWQPWSLVDDWLLKLRSIDSEAVSALELAAGYWAWSGETDDYNATRSNGTKPGAELDVVLFEGPVPFGLPPFPSQSDYSSPPWDPTYNQILQIAKRQLGPFYKRPNNLPSDYDPGTFQAGPLSQQTPRGPRTCIGFEPNTYTFVRDSNVDRANNEINFLRSLGYE